MPSRRRNRTRTKYFAIEGGLDVVASAITVKPGRALAMQNFEPWFEGGYRRIEGYERFDGRPRPSDATFIGFNVDDVTGLSIGDTITGDTSGATGVLIGIWDDDGTYSSDAIGVTKVVGTFQNGETCNTADFTVTSAPITRYAPSEELEATFLLEAEDDYRDDIGVVPGSGQVLATWRLQVDVYAIRPNAGNTAGVWHVSSAAGFTTTGVTMARYVKFDAGVAAGANVEEGDTLTGGTSGATGTVHRIVLNNGSVAWDGSGEGYFVLTNVTGSFQDNEALESPALTTVATANNVDAEHTFPAVGDFDFVNHNFFGGSGSYRTYGCNAADYAFEIDENGVVSPIFLPSGSFNNPPGINAGQVPFLVAEHRNHLFFAYPGGRLAHSAPGQPFIFSGFLDAADFGLGDEITSLNSLAGNVLIITTERKTYGLFGTGVSDWELRLIAEKAGAVLRGAKEIDTVYSLSDTGVSSVSRADQFGDFVSATVSKQIQPLIANKRIGYVETINGFTTIDSEFNDSSIVRKSNQFRMFFEDGECIVMFAPAGTQTETRQSRSRSQQSEYGFLRYPIPVRRIFNGEDEVGTERTYFVTSDVTNQGYVFEDQIGRNFDGNNIEAFVRLVFNHMGSPGYRKKYRRVDFEIQTSRALSIQVVSDLTYGSPNDPTSSFTMESAGSSSFWDSNQWDELIFEEQSISTGRADLRGTGENISFLLYNDTAKAEPWILQGAIVHYDLRRLQR